ncbi:hypothetical protein A2U01_0095399, partial [Trifolium medium]|nr:hypothetical protein [Trifolium medium]
MNLASALQAPTMVVDVPAKSSFLTQLLPPS